MRQKTCKNSNCKQKFTPERQMQSVCSFECSIEYSKQLKDKREATKKKNARKALREYKKSDKPILKQKAQQIFNKFIRLRDLNLPCISCDYEFKNNVNNRQAHASHYIAVSKSSKLRFNEDNVHKSCSICNNHLSGNLVEYRKRLIIKIGIDKVEELEEISKELENEKYTEDDFKKIIQIYTKKCKEIEHSI